MTAPVATALASMDVDVVWHTPLFAGLPRESVDGLLAGASARTYEIDSLLFSAGDVADRFFVVVDGSVRLFALDDDGSETIIEIFSAGESFAEAAIFASGRFPVNAEAMAGSRLVRIDAKPFLARLAENRALALEMIASMERWHLRLMGEMWQLKVRSPAQRLAWYMLGLTDVGSGTATVTLPYRKGIIARRIGIAPESLSRALARLAELGVQTDGDEVTIGNVEKLRRFSAG